MLSSHEQQIWDDIERLYAAEAEEPDPPGRHPAQRHRRDARDLDDLPVAAVAGARIAVVLILLGVVAGGLAVGAATALGWLLWRYWPVRSS
ncbi:MULTISPECIES: DUF3040 domain-containing protein [unclassified Geodermatophilus]|uniref:DUF3040 domain-containing protein n=1 Tax=unclassified Geodermatophilus TaxID=2637632 RepID=UPI003EF028EC